MGSGGCPLPSELNDNLYRKVKKILRFVLGGTGVIANQYTILRRVQ